MAVEALPESPSAVRRHDDGSIDVTFPRPDDFHLHLRDGDALTSVAKCMTPVFQRAIIMPNLVPPVTTTDMAREYRDRIMAARKEAASATGAADGPPSFTPLMTLYLTDNTSPDEITRAVDSGIVYAVKLYPAGATTNSDSGVTDFDKVAPALTRMQELGLPLCVHGEVTDTSVDIFDREARFLSDVLPPLRAKYPDLKIIVEHLTTADGVEWVKAAGPNTAATITAHHLLFNRNAIFDKGLRPHMYCLPVLKSEPNRRALWDAVKSGSPKFFLGSDSAPHPVGKKHASCCSAGIFTGHATLELYALAFDAEGCLDKLPAFASEYGAKFYGLAPNDGRVKLRRAATDEAVAAVPATFAFGDSELVPLLAGERMPWTATIVTGDTT